MRYLFFLSIWQFAFMLYSSAVMAQAYLPALQPFYHGVASGDPMADRVILWTRVTDPDMPATIEVRWQIATDTSFCDIVNSGLVTTNADQDYTVKIDADGLQPYTYYFYRFWALGRYSLIGRTKTAPAAGTPVSNLKFAVASCANYSGGYFLGYDKIKDRNNVDAVIHLGDYIYEYESNSFLGGERPHEPDYECLSLGDYRMRYSQYKRDTVLMRLHQNFPFIIVWDDHETANDAWFGGASNHDSNEGDWFVRKAAGMRAWREWQPVRLPEPVTDPARIFRKISYGNLADIFMLDTRLYGRQQQDGTSNNDPNRTILGAAQYNWLTNELQNSIAQWKILGNQVMIAPMKLFGVAVNQDQWDGYPAERQNLLNFIMNNNISNVVVLTGDIHSAWANDVPYTTYNASTGAGSAAVEFVTASITTSNFPFPIGEGLLELSNPHNHFVDITSHGYILLDVNAVRTQADWYFTPEPTSPSYVDSYETSWYVNANERFLRQGSGPAPTTSPLMYYAPANPPAGIEVQTKVFLQGCFNDQHGIGNKSSLRAQGLIPTTQPFNTAPWYYTGTESLTLPSQISQEVADWVLIELRNAADPDVIVDRVAGFLYKNGNISDTDGNLNGIKCNNAVSGEPYLLVVRPRSHLAVMSAAPLTTDNCYYYDFSTGPNLAYGSGQTTLLATNIYGLYCGDYDHNGVVNEADFDVFKTFDGQSLVYTSADGNMNAAVDINDFLKYRPNAHLIGLPLLRY